MNGFWKQFAVVVLALLVLTGCWPFGRNRAPFRDSVPPPPPPPATQEKAPDKVEKPPPAQLLNGVELASLKAWDGYEYNLPEKKTPVKKPDPVPSVTGKKTLLVVGDSLSVGVGSALSRLLKDNDRVWVREEGKVSSGLNSPKFYDWYQKMRELVNTRQPDAVVIIIGGNDANNGSGSEAWAENYQRKVESFLSIASQKGIQVYWAGLPPMRKSVFNEKVKKANQVIRSACDLSSNCHYIDTWDLVAGNNNEYVPYKKLDGRKVVIRARDGTHFTIIGYNLLGKHIIAHMADL